MVEDDARCEVTVGVKDIYGGCDVIFGWCHQFPERLENMHPCFVKESNRIMNECIKRDSILQYSRSSFDLFSIFIRFLDSMIHSFDSRQGGAEG